jgi:thioredoxin reductase
VPDTEVRISYRRDRFGRIKPGNRDRIESAARAGRVEVLWNSTVGRIESGRVWLTRNDEPAWSVENDQVLIFAGGELPTTFLQGCGIEIDTHFGTAR